MCGIAGGLGRRSPPREAELRLAADRLAHRGPDDTGLHFVDAVGLVHTRLAIIDLAGGHQPILDPTGDLAIVVNGEIYNFVELQRELEAAGRHFETGSDSEVVLHLYAEGGIDAFRRLHGMFAFALYDRRRRSLILVRDRLGIKPQVLMRRWAAGDLPPGHLSQAKRGFGVPLAEALTGARLTRIAARLEQSPLIREWFGRSTLVARRAQGAALRPLLQLPNMLTDLYKIVGVHRSATGPIVDIQE